MKYLAFDECATLWEIFQRGRRVSNDGPCLGWRPANGAPYSWLSYSQVEEMGRDFGAGLIHLGINGAPVAHDHDGDDNDDDAAAKKKKQPFIGIYSQNNPKWMIAAEAAWMYSVGIVPLYDTLGSTASSFIINQAKIPSVIVDTASKVRMALG